MKRAVTAVAMGLVLPLVSVAPASAQAFFFPDYALPSATEAASTWIAPSYGRGLNDASGKVDAYGAAFGRATQSVSFAGVIGVADLVDTEVTVGGSVAVDVLKGPATVSLQGGIGWVSMDILTESITTLRFPIGVALKGNIQSPEANITPWVMPRLNIVRASASGASATTTDLGASAGVGFTFANGFGVHTALDVLVADGGEPWSFMVGAHYLLASGN